MNPGSLADWAGLFGHFLVLSLLAVGGALATAPDMHRYLVVEQGWLDDAQFTSSIALAQAAPGPNILFVAVLGWNVAGLAGACVAMLGIMLPSSLLAMTATRWGARRRDSRPVRAFLAGMTPLTLGLLAATGYVLTEPTRGSPAALALVALVAVVHAQGRASPLVLVALGAVLGALGWV